jgi:pyruvate ferredoxin oxidoreductase beta subunit
MEPYSVYVPQLLPRRESFVAGPRSCPGCGQASASRIIGKAIELHRGRIYGPPRLQIETAMLPYERWPEFGKRRGLKKVHDAGKLRNVLALAGDAGTFAEMLPHIIAAREKNRRLLYVCFMNEAGIERSAQAPAGACGPDRTKTLSQRFAEIRGLIHRVEKIEPDFLATACPSYPYDLMEKTASALDCPGISVLAVLVPCPTGCLYEAALSVQSGRMAVESGIFPLYQVRTGEAVVMCTQAERPVADYVRLQQVCPRPHPDEVARVQRDADRLRRSLKKASKATSQNMR